MKTTIQHLLSIVLILGLSTGLDAAGSSPKKPKETAEERERAAIQLYNEGTALLFESDFRDAEKLLKRSLKKNKELAEAHNNLAFALRKQGPREYSAALKHYNKAIELNPKLAEAYMYRGVLHVGMGNAELASADLTILKGLSPKLATELEWVIENGKEKEPARFFGVTEAQS